MASDCEVRTLSFIGSEIKSWCKQNKVNQTELAAALDVSTMTVRTDMGERCIEYAKNLNKGYRTEMQQKAITNIKSKCGKNEDLERRLKAAMNSVMDIEDVKKKEIIVQQIELILKAAAI